MLPFHNVKNAENLSHFFSQKFRESNIFTQDVTEDLIWRNVFGESKFFIFPHCNRTKTIIIKLTFLLATSFHSIIRTVKKLVLKSGTTSSSFVALESCIENLRGINFYVTFNESSSFFFFRH